MRSQSRSNTDNRLIRQALERALFILESPLIAGIADGAGTVTMVRAALKSMQAPCDVGLFGDDAKQVDLEDLL